jgi:Protein of unknown function (DUF2971)
VKTIFSGFKFRIINKYLIDSLVKPSLYFAKPDTLNDPFDCRLNLTRAFQRRLLSNNCKEFIDEFSSKLENIGVCSFSSEINLTLMWSHYANDHKGVCLYYEFPENFLESDILQLVGPDTVKYDYEPATDFMTRLSEEKNVDNDAFIETLIRIYLLSKNPAWAYEKERRIIRREHGIVNIDGNFLKKVCFGLNTPKTDIDLITELARKYCNCTIFAQIVRDDESDFGLTIKTLS